MHSSSSFIKITAYPKELRINVQDETSDFDEKFFTFFFLFMLYIPTALRMIFLIYRVLYRIYSSRRSAAV